MKKLPKNLIVGLHTSLKEFFFEEGKYTNKVIEKILNENNKWGSRDRRFVSESFYEIIRWKRHYEFFINEKISKKNIYKIIASYLLQKEYSIEDIDIFSNIDFNYIKNRFKEEFPNRAIKHSIEDWQENLFDIEVENWEEEMKSLNEKSKTILRVNTLKTDIKTLQKLLLKEGIETKLIEGYPLSLELIKRKKITHLDLYKKGYFEIQDANSQKVIDFLDIKKDMQVIDSCAGAGGKTLQIGEILNNSGDIIAFDTNKNKLIELEKRAKRSGIKNIMTKPIKKISEAEYFKGIADRILIDVPCSGLGVLKRNPDTKWKLTEDFLNKIILQQKEIIEVYSQMLKKGGKLVYSTCSILRSENEEQINFFLYNNSDFKLIEECKLFPKKTNFDGFYIAVLEKKN